MSKTAHITVPQGLGDIFWVYRLVYNHFDHIHFYIASIPKDTIISERSLKLFNSFPKVESVQMKVMQASDYQRFIMKAAPLTSLFDKNKDVVHFNVCCNRWLEEGGYLEDLDPRLSVAWEIPIPIKKVKVPSEYLVLYASGEGRHLKQTVWHPLVWAAMADQYLHMTHQRHMPVIVIGASFDAPVQDKICAYLKEMEIPYAHHVDLPMDELCYVLKNSKCFIGYQSGLNILADHLDVNQLIVYFNTHPKLTDTWVKPANRKNGLFQYCKFEESMAKGLGKLV